jgi:adenine-specific DNA-methyltransferase
MNKRDFARQLRKNATDAERKLWRRLRDRRFSGYKFRRQHPIGPYVVDFVCLEQRLVIELDGGQHLERRGYDRNRDRWLANEGYRILRFPDNAALRETEAVLQVIWKTLHAAPSSGLRPPSPPVGRRNNQTHSPCGEKGKRTLSPWGRGIKGEG